MNFLLWIIIAILSLFVLYNLITDIKNLMQKKMHEGFSANYYDKKTEMDILFSKELKQNKKPKIAGTNIKEVIKTEIDSKEKCEFELENQRDASGNDGLWNVFAYNVTAKQCRLYDGEINKDSEYVDDVQYNTYNLPPQTQLNVFELENQKNGSCPVGCAKPVCISGDCNEIIVRNNKEYKKCPYKCVGGNQRRTDVSLEDAGGCRYNSECKDVCDHKLFLGNKTNAGKWDWQHLSCGDTDANADTSNSGSTTENDQESRQRYSRGQYCDSFCKNTSDGKQRECTEGCKIRDCPNCGGPPLTEADYAADDSVDMINPMTGENRLGGSKTEFDRRMKNNKAQSKFYYDSVWKLFG